MKENVIQKKSFSFAVRVINLCKFLNNKNEYVLSKQILRCGTSIGANIEEAIGGVSKKDFINKISIAYKEARETYYWLRLLKETNYISEKIFVSLKNDCEELIKIITSIQKTIKKSSNN